MHLLTLTRVLRNRWVAGALFVAAFALFSANFAYFFVDDEAIPFIYAHNLLEGHGLVYNPDDGPVEAYSDFLTVWIDTVLLSVARLGGGDKVAALALGKIFSFAYACVLVGIAYWLLTTTWRPWSVPVLAGMTFLALAGPLALWAWSGLETTLFALLVAVLVATLLSTSGTSHHNDRVMLAAIVLLMLCRIDGFVWVGALLFPFLLAAQPKRRHAIVSRVIVPAVAILALYHGWRVWYFGEVLPMPVYAKVLYKLGTRSLLIANHPAENYVIAFLTQYAWLPALILGAALIAARARSREHLALAIGVLSLVGYLALVGDWMFGFRFWVALLVPLAILAAAGFDRLCQYSQRLAAGALLLWILAIGYTAAAFEARYEQQQQRTSWLREPTFDPARFFAPYYQIYLHAREEIRPGDTLAYNQAGFVPFMLEARNIDDLGICTKFYAKLPTTDIVFTEVGRYSLLSPSLALRASDMYTVARAPRLLLAPGGNVRAANGGRAPHHVLGDRYQLRFTTDTVAAYVPVSEPTRVVESEYLENLAHVSHLTRASLDGAVIRPAAYRDRLPFLFEQKGHLQFLGQLVARFTFSHSNEHVSRLFIGGMWSTGAQSIELRLCSVDGRLVHRQAMALPAESWRGLDIEVPTGIQANELSITITPDDPEAQDLDLVDLRVQGQTKTLQQFLRASRVGID